MDTHPTAGVSQVFGLLDILRSCKGKTDVAKLNVDHHLDLDELLPTIGTAELLGLVDVKDGDIALTDFGRKIRSSGIQERKRIVAEQLRKTELYQKLLDSIKPRSKLSRETIARVVEEVAGAQPDLGEIVAFTIRWGVFAELFGYDGSSLTLRVQSQLVSS